MTDKNDKGVGIVGVGKYIPTKEFTNEEIEKLSAISAGDILEKTGIQTRYIVEDDQTASQISADAARQAINMANIDAKQIGLIICCTFSGDYVYPATACKIAQLIGAGNAGAFDIMANCTGFQVGLMTASDRMMADSSLDYVLVVGVAVQSRFINWEDFESSMYFGDGAGAAILGRVPAGYGFLASSLMSNSVVFDSVRLRGGGSSFPLRADNINQSLQYYEMNGMEVWKQVIKFQPKVIKDVLSKVDKTPQEVDFMIFHQANLRLIEYLMAKMRLDASKTYTNVDKIGNTADASIPIALCEAVTKGKISRDQLVVISGVGAGFIFGASVIRWY